MSNNSSKWQPLVYGLLIAIGILIGVWLKPPATMRAVFAGKGKFSEILSIVNEAYVDSVNREDLEETTINEMLTQLDPHSVYIPAKDLQLANEQLEGNFEGIGVEFNILNDTIMVVSALSGGPSQELGIQSGDRIVRVDTQNVAGVGITNEKVFKLLRGAKGTDVEVGIYRPAQRKITKYNITRNTIPIYSIDASFMLDKETGLIKISRFSATTHDEFLKAVDELKDKGLKNLIVDLRGNPGGYLSAATELADELLEGKKLIVYTEGRTKPKTQYATEQSGVFENGKLVLLIDEGSASASEILSGAVQDWIRGLIVGRRSFGKGLVQEPFELKDGSALRLTVSRYYTPSGRCIQKDYKKAGIDNYENDLMTRYQNGELEDESKKIIFDSTIYKTKVKGRTVYGGGGIYPDVFVSLDTSHTSAWLTNVVSNGLIAKFAYDYLDRNRPSVSAIKDVSMFASAYKIGEPAFSQFLNYTTSQKVQMPSKAELEKSAPFVKTQLKALIARQLWRDNGYYMVMSKEDKTLQKALGVMKEYDKFLKK